MMDTTFYMQLDALIGHHEYDKAEEFLLEAFQEAFMRTGSQCRMNLWASTVKGTDCRSASTI